MHTDDEQNMLYHQIQEASLSVNSILP